MADAPGEDDVLSRLVGDAGLVRRAFDQMPLLVLALEGPELRIAAVTAAYRAYSGRSKQLGMPVREAFAELMGQQVFQIFDQVYASGQPQSLREFRLQFDLPDIGGKAERFVDFTVQPMRGAAGEIIGLIATAEDATERVRERQAAQRRAREAERRYTGARDVIDSLQRELLPLGVPVLPRVQIAASYLLANAEDSAGGDWFDCVALPDGRVGLIVGDVVGHGVAASASMGQLRVLLHERLAATSDIEAALRAVDAAANTIRGGRAATVCVLVLDPDTGAVRYCTAGHPPPLVLGTTGEARYLPVSGAGPLGVGGAFTAEYVASDRLTRGEMVLLYSDGILERPGRELAHSTVELARASGDIAADRALRDHTMLPAERVATQTLELLIRLTGHSDDVTLLAAQLVPAAPDLSLTVPATTDQLGEIRARLDDWLDGIHAGPADTGALRHAVIELTTNAMEHAYADSGGSRPVTVTARFSETGDVRLRVIDEGRWREPRPSADRGLGLHMTSKLVDTVRVEHDDDGTTATVSHRLTRPARLLTGQDVLAGAPDRPPLPITPMLVLDQPSAPRPRLRVDGPVDAATAAEFDAGVRTAGSTGGRSLTVDLAGVSHLASAGVAVLYQLVAQHRDNGSTLRLYAPTGSPADMIMTLVGLPHETHDPDYPGEDPLPA
jgi:anti-anti-sigma factor